MAAYTTPGVYYERMDATSTAITPIRTDVAGFVGIAASGPLDTPAPVQSWKDFQAYFGGFIGNGFLAYAVRGFFENGGRRCWVVRVASNDPAGGASSAALEVLGATTAKPVWKIAASSPGIWGNSVTVSLRATNKAQTKGWLEKHHPERILVESTAGFERGTLVRLSQPGKTALRVVAFVDATSDSAANKYLVWLPDKPGLRLPYDTTPLTLAPDETIQVQSVEYTIIAKQAGFPLALYQGLSLIPEHPSYGPTVLPPLRIPTDLSGRHLLPPVPAPLVITVAKYQLLEEMALPPDNSPLTGGRDGLRLLTAYDFIGEPTDPLDSDLVKASKIRGVRALEYVEEVSILAVPDINIQPIAIPPTEPLPPCIPDKCLPIVTPPEAPAPPPQDLEMPPTFSEADIYRVLATMIEQCEQTKSRVALIDPPLTAVRDQRLGIAAIQTWRSRFDSTYAALYFPWLRVVDPLRGAGAITRDIPASGHVAGQYARTDLAIGVHKAPANAPLAWVQDVTIAVNDAQQGVLNPRGIDAIRILPGRGIRIFGARTVSSDPDWRFINIRRLLIMIEKAIYRSTQWAVFEPNDAITQAKLRLSLTSFLLALWQRGALAGSTAEQAFFVRCDETTNPPSQRANGELLALVGVAPVNPFEFVVIRVGRTANEFEIAEQTFGMRVQ